MSNIVSWRTFVKNNPDVAEHHWLVLGNKHPDLCLMDFGYHPLPMEHDYGLFKKKKPRTWAVSIIREHLTPRVISNSDFVYIPTYERLAYESTITVYYKNKKPWLQ